MGSSAVVVPSPRKSPTTSMRRTNKPLVEKKRRARINGCLGQLKSLILSAMKTEGTQVSRLEKADILEMTVKYLRHIQRQQAASAMTSEPEVVAKFSAGYSECAAEVIRYMDSVSGVTADVRSRLESHLVGRLQGSVSESTSVQSASSYAHCDVKPVINHVTSTVDEMSLHYQTAIELANMASTVTSKELSVGNLSQAVPCAEGHVNNNNNHHYNISSCHVKESPSIPEDKLHENTLVAAHHAQFSSRPKSSSPKFLSKDSVNSASRVASMPSSQAEEEYQLRSTNTASASSPQFYDNPSHQSVIHRFEYSTVPTPPDTPPHNNDINNNVISQSGTRYIRIQQRPLTNPPSKNYNINNMDTASDHSQLENNGSLVAEEEMNSSRRELVIKTFVSNSNSNSSSVSAKDNGDIEMKNETNGSEPPLDTHRLNEAMNPSDSYPRHYDLSAFQQPLHIHIPDSPTPTTTPSPPQLVPSHMVQTQCNRPVPTVPPHHHHHHNIPNAVLPTILYGVGGSDVVVSAINVRSEPSAHPSQTTAIKAQTTTAGDFHLQNTCSLDNNCSNSDGRAQLFGQSAWTASEYAQNKDPFEGHGEHMAQPQPRRQHSRLSSSSLSPPTLTRQDLPLPAHATHSSPNNAEDSHVHRTHLGPPRRHSHDSEMAAFSRRLTFDEDEHDQNTTSNNNNNNMDTQSVFCDRLRQRCFRDIESGLRYEERKVIDFHQKRSRSPPSPPANANTYRHPHQPCPPPHHSHSHRRFFQCAQGQSRSFHQHQALSSSDQNHQENKDSDHSHDRILVHPRSLIATSCSQSHSMRRGEEDSDGRRYYHHSSSSSSPSSSFSPSSPPCSSPPLAHTVASSHQHNFIPAQRQGMRCYRPETTPADTTAAAATTTRQQARAIAHHYDPNNMNGCATAVPRDLSRQNVSPLSPPTLKRLMMGQGLEVSARPLRADARPADASAPSQRRGGVGGVGVKGQPLAIPIPCRVPRGTPLTLLIERTVTTMEGKGFGEGEGAQMMRTTSATAADFAEERLWRPW